MNQAAKMRPIKPKESGFSLIEVLVTMVVVALGLLGFAGLQTYSLKSNRISMQHSMATMYGYGIIDSMRANRAEASSSKYNIDYGGTPATSVVASQDLSAWSTNLSSALPSAQGKITVTGSDVTIWIRWKEGMSAGNPYIVWSTQTTL